MTCLARRACAALVVLAYVIWTTSARAGDPNLEWFTIETPHFRIHYHGGLEEIAQRTASLAEAVRERLSVPLADSPHELVHILLTDSTDSANGSATIVPYDAIRLFVTAPEDLSTLGDYDDWLTELVTHESAHVHHIDNISGPAVVLNAIFGKIYAPNQIQPSWIREGLAVAMESLLSSGGRVRSSIFDMYLRADVLEGNFATLDQMSQDVRRWPGGDIPYLYGGKFMGWIVATYGEDVLGAVATDYGGNLVPWGINRSIRRATGRTYLELYDAWRASVERDYRAQAEAIRRRGLRVGARLTHSGQVAASPRWIPPIAREGTREEILYYRDDGHTPVGLYRLPLFVSRYEAAEGDARLVARTSGSPRVGSFDREGGIVFDSTVASKRRHSFDDLHRLGPHDTSTTGRLATRERWTTGIRARAPDLSPDGRRIVFITNHAGTMTPRIADILPTGGIAKERSLVATARWDQAFTPRFSPDGKRVAYSAWSAGGYRDVRVVDLKSGTVTDLTHDRAQDLEPAWTPDGRYIVFSSDRSGVPNIYAYELATGALKQVTNVLSGAFMPEPSPDGRTLAYVGYTSAGFDLFSLPFDESAFLEALPPAPSHPEVRPSPAPRKWPVIPYTPWATLRPHNYTFDYSPSRFGQALTITLRGSDITANHSFGAYLTRFADIDELAFGISYAYTRLPFDLRMSVSRTLAFRTLRIEDLSFTGYDDTLALTSRVGYSIPGSFDTATVALAYSATSSIRKFPTGYPLDPYNGRQIAPARQFQGIVELETSYVNTYRSLWGISTERGFAVNVSSDLAGAATGSEATLTRFEGRGTGYVLAPWLRHHVFALALSAGTATGSPSSILNTYSTGGFYDQEFGNTISDFIGDLNQSPIVLRGYPPGAFSGSQYNLMNLEYRFPIAILERGVSTLPIFFDYVSGTLFFDYGGAFDHLNLEDPMASYHGGVGGQIHFEFTLGYFLDTGFTLGWARALDRKTLYPGQGSQTYLVIVGSF